MLVHSPIEYTLIIALHPYHPIEIIMNEPLT